MFKTKIQNIFSRGPGALCSFLQGGQKIEVTPLGSAASYCARVCIQVISTVSAFYTSFTTFVECIVVFSLASDNSTD